MGENREIIHIAIPKMITITPIIFLPTVFNGQQQKCGETCNLQPSVHESSFNQQKQSIKPLISLINKKNIIIYFVYQ